MEALKFMAAVTAVVIVVLTGIRSCMDIPVVYKDHLTRECVKVESPDNSHTCAKLPSKYETVWVGPQ